MQHFSIRQVSKSVTLNELGRILSRNSFALVEGDKFVTSSDLLNKISPKAGEDCCTPAGCTLTKQPEASNQAAGNNMLQMAAAAMVGMGVAALGTFMLMNSKK